MELEKFKEKNKKKTGIIIFTICCILLIAGVYLYSSFAIYEQNQNFNIINGTVEDPGDVYFSFYVDGVISKTMPTKDSGYTLDTTASYCTNGASPILNTDDWSVSVNNLTVTNTKCTLYFVKGVVGQIIDQLDKTGACPTVNEDGTVEATSDTSTNGDLCSAPDDYGTSYYYRGNVTNNYVKFGDYYWRIIRINGDGSIRMIYDGTSAHANGESSADRQIGTSVYNTYDDDSHSTYVGYMYGEESTIYEEIHANTHDSTVKTYLDTWYKTNIEEKNLSNYISDTLFCNDRSITQEAGTSNTYFRWFYGLWSSTGKQYPRLTCAEQNDRFTVNDEVIGNGDLTYPISLITADEVALAGGYIDIDNSQYYLYTGNDYWTISPYGFNLSSIDVIGTYADGEIGYIPTTDSNIGVRPIINLKADSLKVGSGTMDDPWRIAD